ncbi:MAG TPA: methyltransferase domain-containing protein [Acidimicrobiales bacterium]|nr:methyltransferase domain-containing protein [Acidimicrobiales bacterium]
MTSAVAAAYDRTGAVWQAGPGLIYDRLAEVTLDRGAVDLAGSRVLDLGAGTGAGGRAAQARGAEVFSLDAAFGMLAAGASHRPPAVVGDALGLPFRAGPSMRWSRPSRSTMSTIRWPPCGRLFAFCDRGGRSWPPPTPATIAIR